MKITDKEIQNLLGTSTNYSKYFTENVKYQEELLKKKQTALKIAVLLSKEGVKIPAAHSVLEIAESYFKEAADTSKLFSVAAEILD